MALPKRNLGKNGPLINAIGFGTMSIGGAYSDPNGREANLALLDEAYRVGQWFWDTADIYRDSEETIGEWFARNPEKRKDIFLATKFALSYDMTTWQQFVSNDPEYIRKACASSLKKLQVDSIDLYYVHRIDPKVPIETTMKTLVELKNEGKIKHIGLSEASAATLRRAVAVHPVAAHQIEYSAFTLNPAEELLSVHRELGITTVAYSPIGRGFLTGQVKSMDDLQGFNKMVSRNNEENFKKILELVHKFEEVAKSHGAKPSQVAIAWLLAQGEDIIPIPGTKSANLCEQQLKQRYWKAAGILT
ncbi:Aldo-keto yakc [NADP(+)] [Cyphellophora attinorum]|uniref:Aldo-keto yakc [NADP(+)] n=1 Tax=Cyphellophora attinorum TaxID=1664694 RepID=A0A0N1H891_9EURO|nr:Aldo-keto yakc [NADP(+)] [Phialophora attinorum]KPI38075.1 Aldo-keto yakc [NADP(+)] [Phialophora attinorum]